MNTSSRSTRKSTLNEPDEDQERHDSKRLRLVDVLDVSVDTMDSVYLDVGICGAMNATTTHEIIAMTVEEFSDPKNVKTEVQNSQQWKTNLLPDELVYGTKSAKR